MFDDVAHCLGKLCIRYRLPTQSLEVRQCTEAECKADNAMVRQYHERDVVRIILSTQLQAVQKRITNR
jgi:hypothetical protein